ncbi:FliH/SctL family protein [Thalassoglobus sp. JC818]|uniref:FliH/SctL family protein n=1 Tax=Thalassoglobus sp. JC818 TaxID=3232136 RepID=UPI00345A9879
MTASTSKPHRIRFQFVPTVIKLSPRSPVSLTSGDYTPFTPGLNDHSSQPEVSVSVREVVEPVDDTNKRTLALLAELSGQLQSMSDRREQLLEELQEVAVELSIAVASSLVFHAIDRDEFEVDKLVASAIGHIAPQLTPIVVLHPQDLAILQKSIQSSPETWADRSMELRSDNQLERGSCKLIEPQIGELVSNIGTRLSEIRRHWLEDLDDTQVERRQAEGKDQRLRRFPDRRETA